jgi:UDP-N-acetylmuramoyl-tripeptide--D-alanyl-D-alanine ligase
MDALSLAQIANWSGGTIVSGDPDTSATRVSKDTRTLEPGDLYLALHGDNHDGNTFVADAIRRGAAAALLDADVPVPPDFPVIRVADTLAALQSLASAYRNELNLHAIGITGSSGKTSTKEFTAAVLSARYPVAKTLGNLNNHFGLPLTILEANSTHQAAVWEMGMNHPGEIATLAEIGRPDAAIITNIGTAHIEFFPETGRDGIAAEKSSLAEAIGPDGVVILPNEDDYTDFIAARCKARVVRAGLTGGQVTGTITKTTPDGTTFQTTAYGETAAAHLPVPGEHMVRNALLAIAAGLEHGLSLEDCIEGLQTARLTGGRLKQTLVRGIRIIDDSYNANPDSVEAALKTLASIPTTGRRIAVLGRMGELGTYAETGYARVGQSAANHADILITTGPETAPLATAARESGLTKVHETKDTAEAATLLRDLAREGDTILIKGSRSAKMEQVLEKFSA